MKIPEGFEYIHDENNIRGFFGDYRFLSNMWPCLVNIYEHSFKSSEHAYQWAKTKDNSYIIHPSFVDNMTGSEVKNWGQKIDIRSDWQEIKEQVMFDIVYAKFTQNKELQKLLLSTGDKYLEERNWWSDAEWGVNYKTGNGKNKLGKILTKVRNVIKWEAL